MDDEIVVEIDVRKIAREMGCPQWAVRDCMKGLTATAYGDEIRYQVGVSDSKRGIYEPELGEADDPIEAIEQALLTLSDFGYIHIDY